MLPSLETGRVWGVPLRAGVLVVLAGILCWNICIRWEMLLQHRTELGGVEHNVIHGIQKVMLGQRLYEDPEKPPFDVMQYTPAYYVLCAGIGQVLGITGDDARAIYLLSRTVALLFNLLTCWYVYRCGRACGAPSWASLFVAGITFCTFWEHFFTRMDAMAAAASFAAFHGFGRWNLTQQRKWMVITAVFGVLAFMSKQSGIVAIAAPVVYITVQRLWRALGTYIVASSVALIVSFGLIFLCLGTPLAFYQNTVLGLRNGSGWHMYIELFNPPTYKYFVGWHLLTLFVLWHGFRSSSYTTRFLTIALPLSLVFAMVTGLKYGSRLNYIHESLVLTFLLAAVLFARLPMSRTNVLAQWAFVLYGLLFAAFRTNSALAWYRVGEPDALYSEALQADEAVRSVLVNELGLKSNEGIFITYREYLEHFFVGQSMLTQKDIVQYSKDRLFDYTRFHQAMNNGSIRFVITDGSKGPITYLDSTYTGWSPIRTIHGRVILAREAGQ